MVKLCTVVVIVAACGGGKKSEPAKPEPAKLDLGPAKPIENTATIDPACTAETAKLGAWLKDLASEGHPSVMTKGLKLATLPDAAMSQVPLAPAVIVKQDELSFQGQLVAANVTGGKPADLAKSLGDALKKAPAGKDVMFVIDGLAPWPATVALVNAAAGAGRTHATFVFTAGAPSKVSAPPASAIDNDLLLATKDVKAADLGKPAKDGGIPGKVFKTCPQVTTDLFPKLAADSADRDALVVDGLPKAIAACNCKVEMASVQRLMWAWWDRDAGTMMTSVSTDIAAKGGTAVKSNKKDTWGDGVAAFVAGTKQGKPITLQ